MAEHASYTLPAPSGGLNLIDAIDAMPENDALELINYYPQGTNISLRGGSSSHCVAGASAAARTLMVLPLQSGTEKLVKAANSKFYDVSTSTETNITGTTTPTSNDWNHTIFNNRIFAANGADTVQVYTGSGNFADATFTGVTLSSLVNVSSYRQRIYFVKLNSGSFWYGGVSAVSGALTEYDLTSFLTRGGYLLFAGSYTNQNAMTSADLFFVVSSEGEVLFFSGTYPGDSTTWSIVARFPIGKPLGYRAFIRVDNDVLILTRQGIVPVSALFSGGSTIALNTIGRKINPLISSYAFSTPFSHLWHGLHWPGGRRIYITVPRAGNNVLLLVCNTDTGAWTKFDLGSVETAVAISLFGGDPYYGSSTGNIYEMESGQSDNGSPIPMDLLSAFNFFGSRSNFKHFVEVRPLMRSMRGVGFGLGIQTDFVMTASTDIINSTPGESTPWGSDWGSPWSSSTEYLFPRYAVRAQGHSGALRIRGNIKDTPLEFNGFDIRFRVGGQI